MVKVWCTSFSYRAGPPQENSVTGIGSIFDCRHLPSPARNAMETLASKQEKYSYLEQKEISNFYHAVKEIIFQSVEALVKDEQGELWFHFGCAAGEVRSVFFAELLKADVEKKFGKKVEAFTYHRENEKRTAFRI